MEFENVVAARGIDDDHDSAGTLSHDFRPCVEVLGMVPIVVLVLY